MEQIIGELFNINVWSVAKIFVLIGLGVYTIFAFVMVQQVKLMTKVVSGVLTFPLRSLAWFFFLFSILVLVLSFLSL